jgi:hypothetical protein
VPDTAFGHHRDRHRLLDRLDHRRVAHAGHTAVAADVGRDPLERHDGDRAGVLGDRRLLGVDDVHDDAAAQHLGQPALHPRGARAALLDHACSLPTAAIPLVAVASSGCAAAVGKAAVAARAAGVAR